MPRSRKPPRDRGWAVITAAAILKPTLGATMRRVWLDGDKIPASGGCVVAANHVSHLDPLTFALFVYEQGRIPRFLAKAALFDVKGAGTILRAAKQIPVFRESADAQRAFRAAVEAVQAGEAVVVYPEGTISRQPDLWPMVGKTGAARIALTAGVPVIPVAQWGANEILFPYTKRPRLFPRKTVYAKAGDPVRLDDLRGQPHTPSVLREASDRIMRDITVLLEEVRQEKAPEELFDPRRKGVSRAGNPWLQRRQSRRAGGGRP